MRNMTAGEKATGRTLDHYEILGLKFGLETDSPEVRDFFRAAYRRFASVPGGPGDELRLVAALRPRDGRPHARAGEERLDLSGRPMPENRAFLFLLGALMARVSRHLLLHGAAYGIGGRGFVLCGPPTAGKSTLVLELGRRGAVFLGDDVAPVERSTGRLQAFPRALGIRKGAEETARLDPSALAEGGAHEMPHKWLVDPEALGLRLPEPGEGSLPLEAVIMIDPALGAESEETPIRSFEVALAEEDREVIAELGSIAGVSGLARLSGGEVTVYKFEIDRRARPMEALAECCRRHDDVVLYLEPSRPDRPPRPVEPLLQEAPWPPLLLDLGRELLNRGEGSALERDCGGLAGLVAELGRVLKGARAYRLRPGTVDGTVDLLLHLTERQTGVTRGIHS